MAKNERLIALRGDRTQEEVARAIGVDRSTYAHIENGTRRPSLRLAFRIASYFGVSVDAIFSPCDVVEYHTPHATAESA